MNAPYYRPSLTPAFAGSPSQSRYLCLQSLSSHPDETLHRLRVSKLPAYDQLLKLGKEREGAILLEIGCCCSYSQCLSLTYKAHSMNFQSVTTCGRPLPMAILSRTALSQT